ncbi:MAG: hypothetical protein LH479_06150, partial [Polaromonas sp.]|nr:hypothetical protein [Polaromonas sp.]
MSSNPDLSQPLLLAACRAALTLATTVLLAGCGLTAALQPADAQIPETLPRISTAVPAPMPVNPPTQEPPEAPAPAAPAAAAEPLSAGQVARVLAYSERLRSLPPAELAPEAARLGAPAEA